MKERRKERKGKIRGGYDSGNERIKRGKNWRKGKKRGKKWERGEKRGKKWEGKEEWC